jgi:hypothetical protein
MFQENFRSLAGLLHLRITPILARDAAPPWTHALSRDDILREFWCPPDKNAEVPEWFQQQGKAPECTQ